MSWGSIIIIIIMIIIIIVSIIINSIIIMIIIIIINSIMIIIIISIIIIIITWENSISPGSRKGGSRAQGQSASLEEAGTRNVASCIHVSHFIMQRRNRHVTLIIAYKIKIWQFMFW